MKDLFEISKLNNLSPQKGVLLISDPFNEDKYFKRSVICLCEHNEKGSFGYVINNILDVNITELVPAINSNDFNVGLGGPVGTNSLYYIHTLGDNVSGSVKVKEGLYTGGDFEQITSLINGGFIDNTQIQFFLGYSGWSSNQLEEEINRNSWIVSNYNVLDLMNNDSKNFWKDILEKKGGKFKAISNFPTNPSLN